MTQKQLISKRTQRCSEPGGRCGPTPSRSYQRFRHTLGPHKRFETAGFPTPPLNPYAGLLIWGDVSSSTHHILKETRTNLGVAGQRSATHILSPTVGSWDTTQPEKRQVLGRTAQWFSCGGRIDSLRRAPSGSFAWRQKRHSFPSPHNGRA